MNQPEIIAAKIPIGYKEVPIEKIFREDRALMQGFWRAQDSTGGAYLPPVKNRG